jgi:hypothetical protein
MAHRGRTFSSGGECNVIGDPTGSLLERDDLDRTNCQRDPAAVSDLRRRYKSDEGIALPLTGKDP